jgi:peptidoglycan/xylan/chitin deacetylase (PgdA/CDA1 family)
MLRNPMFATIGIIILMTLIVYSPLLNMALGNIVNSNNKAVMLGFDGGWKSQITYAKPILDKYGFKASFFIVCGRVGTQPNWMNWQDITELKKDGLNYIP